MKKILLMAAFAAATVSASAQHVEWSAAQLPQTADALAEAGYYTLWGGVNFFGTPGAYTLFDDAKAGVKAYCENISYVGTGNNKYSGNGTYNMKLIMGMNNSTRDGLDGTSFDAETSLADLGYLRSTATADDGSTKVYDAIITLDVASTAEYGRVTLRYNRGGNNSAMYVVDATKSFMVLQSVTRCPDDAVKTHTAMFNVQPGHKYYIMASEKASVELYGMAYDALTGNDKYDGVTLSADNTTAYWDASQLPQSAEALAEAGYSTLWGGEKFFGTPGAYTFFDNETAGVKAYAENVSYVGTGNSKYSGNGTYTMKMIMGMNNSTRDGLDGTSFDAETSLADLGYLRSTATADDGTTKVYDAIVTLDVASTAEYGQVAVQYNRGGNNSAMYVVDATKSFMVLQSVTRCPDDAVKTHTAMFNVQPGHKYYILASEKASVELYKLAYTAVSAEGYDTKFTPTGIQNIQSVNGGVNAQSDVMYNLAGQRVNKAYKGIVIKNGKKYIAK